MHRHKWVWVRLWSTYPSFLKYIFALFRLKIETSEPFLLSRSWQFLPFASSLSTWLSIHQKIPRTPPPRVLMQSYSPNDSLNTRKLLKWQGWWKKSTEKHSCVLVSTFSWHWSSTKTSLQLKQARLTEPRFSVFYSIRIWQDLSCQKNIYFFC